MAEANCNRCKAPIIWLEIQGSWKPFDYGMKTATLSSPKTTRSGRTISEGKGLVCHFNTCLGRISRKMENVDDLVDLGDL